MYIGAGCGAGGGEGGPMHYSSDFYSSIAYNQPGTNVIAAVIFMSES